MKKRILILTKPAKITAVKNSISVSEFYIERNETITKSYSPEDIEKIVIMSNASITRNCIKLLDGKEVLFFSKNMPIGCFIPFYNTPDSLKLSERMSALKKSQRFKLAFVFCKGVCLGRIYNARRLNEYLKNNSLKNIIKDMQTLERTLVKCKNRNELMAIEGNIAKLYYMIFKQMLPNNINFCGRNIKSNDVLNVVLNSAHGILRQKIQRKLIMSGLNTYFGFLHNEKDRNNHYLSFDFSEFWIPYVDKLCFYAVKTNIFSDKDIIRAKENTKSDYWLSGKAWEKMFSLMKRIDDRQIDGKIIEFKQYLTEGKRFSWKLKHS